MLRAAEPLTRSSSSGRRSRVRIAAALLGAIPTVIIALCCLLPLLWLGVQLTTNSTARGFSFDSFRVHLLARTLLYNGSVGIVALLLSLPTAWALGRGRGVWARLLWLTLPIALLMPSLVLAYGWKQMLRLLGFDFDPAGFADILRCVCSLASWLWPIPAIVGGLAIRRADPQVQQQALLDGALGRLMFRQAVGPLLAATCVVAMLAMQEFSVYEPTGISVVATEVRMVFETGAFSSATNPITQTMGAGTGPSVIDQPFRAAAAIAIALPLLTIIALLALLVGAGVARVSAAEHVEVGDWPAALDAPAWTVALSWLTVAIAMLAPIVALVLSLKRPFGVVSIYREFEPQVQGTLFVGAITGTVALLVATLGVLRGSRWLIVVALLSFLVGGQILAIALIRLYNRQWLGWVYDGWPIIVIAYIGRFGWIVLFAAAATFTRAWREVREIADVDGATRLEAARYVVVPLAWPMLGAAALLVLILSTSEVPATVLISPQKPQVLVPMLMTWVHMLRYDAMIECSLILAIVVGILGIVVVGLAVCGARMHGKWKMENGKGRGRITASICLFTFSIFHAAGCRDRSKPEATWCNTGIGPGQVVYPRGIAYSKRDDSFFIVDREARIQHLDRDGTPLAAWRTPAWAQGKPVGLTVGPDGNLWVPDTHYHRILVYSPGGELLREFGERGTGPGQFIYPTDVAFDSAGRIFISEYGDNDRIQVFDPTTEKFLYQIGRFGDGEGEFSRPQSILIDGDQLYLTDACNHRLDVFRTDGKFVRTIGHVGSGLGEFRFPYGLDEDADGDLIVCEFGNNRVQKIDKKTGKGLATWGFAGREPGELAYPWGVAVDRRNRVVAVDAGNNRLQVFEF